MSPYGEQRPPVDSAPTVQFALIPAPRRPEAASFPPPPRTAPPSPPSFSPPSSPVPPPAAPPAPPRRGRRVRVLVAAGAAVGVLVALGGVAAYAYSGDVPRGTTVLGVDLGGLSRAEAAAALRAGLAGQGDRFGRPVPVRIGERTGEVVPAEVGLAVDVDATVSAAADGGPGPLGRLFGSRAVAPVVAVDADKLDAALRAVAGPLKPAMTMPAVTFDGVTPKPVYPRPGKGLDPQRSARAVRDGWLGGDVVDVPLVDRHPATTAADVDKLVAELAEPAVAAPVTVLADRSRITIAPAVIAKSLVLRADATSKITPRIDEKRLRAALADQLGRVEVKPKEATVSIGGGKPRVLASTAGKAVDTAALSRDLLTVLPERDGREVKAVFRTVQPKTTTDELVGLGIKERVSTFTTKFTGGLSSPRSQNIVQISKEVDGAVVKPGETFSLNGHTGERGVAQGYKEAPVILDGKLVPGVGGGASQFTTTLFNATYYAGLEDVEHKPHSYYFSRYPPVIESTIFYPDLDFKFKNNTPHGVLIDTSYTSNSITVAVWSTKVYDSVKTEWSARRNVTSPETIYLDPGPKCIATDGLVGFSQDAYRIIRKGGTEVKREKFTWRYDPEPRYICAKKPA